MEAYSFHFKDLLDNKHGVNHEIFYPGYQMVHHEVEGENGLMLSGEPNKTNFPEHHFTLHRTNDVLAWIVMVPLEKRIAKLVSRFMCTEVDLILAEKIHIFIENFAGKKGFQRLFVHTKPSGLGFYRCLGFQHDSATMQDGGSAIYVMKKEI